MSEHEIYYIQIVDKASGEPIVTFGPYTDPAETREALTTVPGPGQSIKAVSLERGTQIAYIPNHAMGDGWQEHRDVEHGFVTSIGPAGVFCRYWAKRDGRTITGLKARLRTLANSECANPENIYPYTLVDQRQVDEAIREHVEPSELHNKAIFEQYLGVEPDTSDVTFVGEGPIKGPLWPSSGRLSITDPSGLEALKLYGIQPKDAPPALPAGDEQPGDTPGE